MYLYVIFIIKLQFNGQSGVTLVIAVAHVIMALRKEPERVIFPMHVQAQI
jgi:hypothetical protein